jgi:hypothetical protein
MSLTKTTIQLETTPRVYYEHYMSVTPSYDLYPSLCRRLGNGYVHRPPRPARSIKQQTNFICMNSTSSRHLYDETQDPLWRPIPPAQQENATPPWDLYPAILRNVSI